MINKKRGSLSEEGKEGMGRIHEKEFLLRREKSVSLIKMLRFRSGKKRTKKGGGGNRHFRNEQRGGKRKG